MPKTSRILSIIIIGILMSTTFALAAPHIGYELAMTRPYTHLLEVQITFEDLEPGENHLDLIMPVWRPGRYVIFDFAGGVQEFSAHAGKESASSTDQQKALSWWKTDKTTWRVATEGHRAIRVSYKVYANEFNLRTRGLNDQHAFVNGAAVFMYVEKFRPLPIALQIHSYGNWHVSTGLDRVKEKNNLFQAPNYDYFVDCPLEIGNQQDFEFEVQGKKHYLSISGSGNWKSDKLIERLEKVVQANFEFWDDLPYEHYSFLVHSMPGSGGGTEHINSTIMGINPFSFNGDSGYENFTSLAMHEFFHTWNVKQLRPADLHPYDYTHENYSRLLWVAEGTTSYYTTILMRRAGFTPVGSFINHLATTIRSDRQRPGRRVQSLEESSYDAWIKFWKNSPNNQNGEVDYYDKGAMVSMLLDLEIRQRTQNRVALDDVMRTLYRGFPLSGTGYAAEDFEKAVNEAGGGDYREFFEKYVRGTAELEFARYLGYAGLEVQETPAPGTKPSLGISVRDEEGRAVIQRINSGTAGYDAGLNVGDEILALNGFRLRANQLQQRLGDFIAGDKIQLTLFRNDQLRQFDIVLQPSEVPEITVTHTADPSELQKKIYASWVNASWPEPAK
jgi:predicted metalloprotease with PDZ domain